MKHTLRHARCPTVMRYPRLTFKSETTRTFKIAEGTNLISNYRNSAYALNNSKINMVFTNVYKEIPCHLIPLVYHIQTSLVEDHP